MGARPERKRFSFGGAVFKRRQPPGVSGERLGDHRQEEFVQRRLPLRFLRVVISEVAQGIVRMTGFDVPPPFLRSVSASTR